MAENPDRPLLTRLRVQNFRSLADVTVEFGPLTVLVGPNGAGKSNVVDALRFLRDAATRGLAQALIDRDGIGAIRRRSKGEPLDVGFELELRGPGRRQDLWASVYSLKIAGDDDAERRVKREHVSINPGLKSIKGFDLEIVDGQWPGLRVKRRRLTPKLGGEGLMLFGEAALPLRFIMMEKKPFNEAYRLSKMNDKLSKQVQASGFYDFTPARLRAPQRLLTTAPLNEEGENLSAVLDSLSNEPDADTMRAALGQLVEGVSGYRVRNVGSYLITELLYEDGEGGEPIASELAQESDGTLRMLGILAALYQDPPLPLVVIEEPETNIHPGALGVLADVFEEASLRSQIIITTHSPDLVDRFPPEALRVVEQVGGETKVGPVRKGQREAAKQKLFSPGELMRMEGLQREEEG